MLAGVRQLSLQVDQQEVEGRLLRHQHGHQPYALAVVMSRNAGFIDQCVELDFQYPSEGIHRRWDAGSESLHLQFY